MNRLAFDASIRGALLPKLISGELEVPEIKKPRDGAA
jgi:hypothetical protein